MSQKINETCKNYFWNRNTWKIHIFLIVNLSAIKGAFGYLDASIGQYGGQHEWEKPLHHMMMDYSVHKDFLSIIAPKSVENFRLFFIH